MKAAFIVLALILAFVLLVALVDSADSWCVAGKVSGPCDSWPMKDMPESLKVHVK